MPAAAKHSDSMLNAVLDLRRRRWGNIKTALVQRIVFAELIIDDFSAHNKYLSPSVARATLVDQG